MIDVTVLGAGISGLTAAWRLVQQGFSVQLVEANPQVGGVIRTLSDAGFVGESGPNTFPANAKTLVALCDSLGLVPLPAAQAAKKRYVFMGGRFHALPSDPLSFLTSGVLSPMGKLRLLMEPLQPRGKALSEESLAGFIRRRLGSEALENLVNPFVSGVYAGDPEQLELCSVFPRLADWERDHGGLFKAMLALRQASRKSDTAEASHSPQPAKPRYQLLSFAGGMQTLTDALAAKLPGDCIRLSTPIERFARMDDAWELLLADGETLKSRSVVMALPADRAAVLLRQIHPAASEALAAIPYVPMAVVHLGFARAAFGHPLDGFGALIPRSQGITTLGCLWPSSLFADRAPADHVLLSCFLGGALHRNTAAWPDSLVVTRVLEDLQTLFGKTLPPPVYQRLVRWERAIPQYTPGHSLRVKTIESGLASVPGLFITGNFLHGISLNDSVAQADAVAERVGEWLSLDRRIEPIALQL